MGVHSSTYSSKYFCLGAFLVLVGAVLLCALGFTVVYPYHVTRDWPPRDCHVTNVSYDQETCSCGQPFDESGSCISKYPCLRVHVHYNMSAGLAQDAMLFRFWSDAFYNECSLYECGDEQWNVKTTRNFQMKYGVEGLEIPCYFNPAHPDQAILHPTPTLYVIHAVVWPGLCLFIGCVVWLGMCLGCWKFEEDMDESGDRMGITRSPNKTGPE